MSLRKTRAIFTTWARAVAIIDDRLQEIGLSDQNNKSMRIINASLRGHQHRGKNGILELLEKCDTDSIRTQIGQAKNNLRTDTIQLRENVTAMNSLSGDVSESRFIVNSVSDASTVPVDNAPGIGHLLLIGLFSIGFGSVVSAYYRPELENLGFESTESAEHLLGLPVVASVTEDVDDSSEPNSVANSVVRYCEVGLFGFFVLTVLLCFVQPELRDAFVENPIYGFSRMVGMFFG